LSYWRQLVNLSHDLDNGKMYLMSFNNDKSLLTAALADADNTIAAMDVTKIAREFDRFKGKYNQEMGDMRRRVEKLEGQTEALKAQAKEMEEQRQADMAQLKETSKTLRRLINKNSVRIKYDKSESMTAHEEAAAERDREITRAVDQIKPLLEQYKESTGVELDEIKALLEQYKESTGVEITKNRAIAEDALADAEASSRVASTAIDEAELAQQDASRALKSIDKAREAEASAKERADKTDRKADEAKRVAEAAAAKARDAQMATEKVRLQGEVVVAVTARLGADLAKAKHQLVAVTQRAVKLDRERQEAEQQRLEAEQLIAAIEEAERAERQKTKLALRAKKTALSKAKERFEFIPEELEQVLLRRKTLPNITVTDKKVLSVAMGELADERDEMEEVISALEVEIRELKDTLDSQRKKKAKAPKKRRSSGGGGGPHGTGTWVSDLSV